MRPGSRSPEPHGGDTIKRNTAFALASQLATAAFTAILTIFLVRALGPHDYGIFALAVGVASLVFLPADLGISQSTARFIAEHRGEHDRVVEVLADGLKLKLISSGALCALLFALAGPIANAYDTPEMAWPLRGVAVAVFGQSMVGYYRTAFEALGRVSLTLRLISAESAVEASASILLVVLGAGVTGAAFGRAIGYLFGTVFAFVLITRLVDRRAIAIRGADARDRIRQIARYAGALLIIDAVFAIITTIDVVLIGAILGPAAVGVFQAPAKLIAFLHYPGLALSAGVSPRLSRGGGGPNVRAFQEGIRYLMIFQAALVVPVVVWAGPITDLILGSGFEESADVMRAMGPFIYLFGIAPLVSVGVNYLGEARRRIPVAILTLVVNFAVSIVLLKEIGVVGSAIGADAAYLIYVPAHFWICKQLLGLPLRPIARTFFRTLACGGAMALVMIGFGTENLTLLDWLAGGATGIATYCVCLVLTGEVSRTELLSIRAMLARRVG